MKLVCSQSDLSGKLSVLSRVVPSNPTHPVLANVLLVAEPGRLGLAVFDLSLGMQVWLPAQVEDAGSITLPARFFNEIVSRLPNSDIEIVTDGPAVTLTCGTGHYQMQGMEAEEFPALPTLEEVEAIALPIPVLVGGLQGALFATSTDETKQILTGLHLSFQADHLEFAATDGHRLAIAASACELPGTSMAVTVPARALRELERLLGRHEANLSLRFDSSQVVFEFPTEQGSERLSCRLLEGQYPAYQQLIPRQFARQVTVERQLLLGGVERIAVLAARRNNIIRLKLDSHNQQLALSAEAPEFGSGEEFLPAQISGDNLDIAFNVKYLGDGLKAMNSTEIQLQFNSETTPAVIRPLSGQKMDYLIMPIQIRS